MATVVSMRSGGLQALEVISDLLLGIEEGDPPGAFFGSLCEAICSLTALRKAVLFSYDPAERRVRALGAHGLEVEPYLELQVTIDSVPLARKSLERDEVLEAVGADDFGIPDHLRRRLAGLQLVCTPMQAAGRCVGVVIGDRDPQVAEIGDEERLLLKTLGKAIAMAVVAREVTRYHERSKQLQQQIKLAREIHEAVVQRLFGVSLVLSSGGELDRQARQRAAEEVERALTDLRAALKRPLSGRDGRATRTLAEELDRQRDLHPYPPLVVKGDPALVPERLQGLVQGVVAEALRNSRKHARPTRIEVAIAADPGKLAVEVVNDGALEQRRGKPGIGLQVLALEALTHGAALEYGRLEDGGWRVRLTVAGEG